MRDYEAAMIRLGIANLAKDVWKDNLSDLEEEFRRLEKIIVPDGVKIDPPKKDSVIYIGGDKFSGWIHDQQEKERKRKAR